MQFISKEQAKLLIDGISGLKREDYIEFFSACFKTMEIGQSFQAVEIQKKIVEKLVPDLKITDLENSEENKKQMEPLTQIIRPLNNSITTFIRHLHKKTIITSESPHKLLQEKEKAIQSLMQMRKHRQKTDKENPSKKKSRKNVPADSFTIVNEGKNQVSQENNGINIQDEIKYKQTQAILNQAYELYLTLPPEQAIKIQEDIQKLFLSPQTNIKIENKISDEVEVVTDTKKRKAEELNDFSKKIKLEDFTKQKNPVEKLDIESDIEPRNNFIQTESNKLTDSEKDIPLPKQETNTSFENNELVKKFDSELEEFKHNFEKECKENYDKLINNREAYDRFIAMNKVGMSFSITYLPKKAKSLKNPEKKTNKDPNDWVEWPLTSNQRAHQFFRQPLKKYHGFTAAQFGSLTAIPLTAPHHNDYIFERSATYNDKNLRIKFLNERYLSFVLLNDFKRAADCLFILFQHVAKQIYFQKRNEMRINYTAVISFINEEIKKLGFKEIPEEIRGELRTKFHHLGHVQNNKQANKKTPIRKMENDVTEKYENGVKIMWVKKKNTITPLKTKIDALGNDDLLLNENVDIYDADTGKFILSFRKNALKELEKEIETLNTYLFMTTKKQLMEKGARRNEDEIDPNIHKTKKIAGSMPTGFLVTGIRSTVTPSRGTTENPYSIFIEPAKGKIAQQAESLYKEIAPEEYQKLTDIMEEFNEFLIPGCKITTTGEFNFDKQTLTHVDPNQLPEKSLAFLTVFYGGPKRRYEEGYTYFPEYKIALDVEQMDLLLASFEDVIHCNTEIKITDDNKDVWHRVPFIGFTRGELLNKATELVVEISDDEHDMTSDQIDAAIKTPPKKQGDGSYTLFNMLVEASQNNEKPSRSRYKRKFEEEVKAAHDAYQTRNQVRNAGF